MKNGSDSKYDVVVIGGGPAGMMAAGRAAERAMEQGRTAKVILLEKNDGLGKKLLLTGGGRCNVTNAELDTRTLLARFKGSDKFLFSAFSQHGVKETLEFFHARGMPTKVEEGQRVFPASDKAQSVWDALLDYLKAGKVTICSNAEVAGFVTEAGEIKAVKLEGNGMITARSFVLATGGRSHPETGSTGDGFEWLAKLGHTVAEPTAALVPVTVGDAWVKKLSGISLPQAKLTLFLDGVKQSAGKRDAKKGKVLFTHFGLSGPAILNMSSEIRDLLKYGEVVLSLDLLPEHDYAILNAALLKLFAKEDKKKLKNAIALGKSGQGLIPAAFVAIALERSGVDGGKACNSITREERLILVKALKDLPIHPTGLLGADKAIVTSGGVKLEEVDFRTMRSRLIPNLYLVGDILDVDRPSGGYSLQLCWTTGWVAGNWA